MSKVLGKGELVDAIQAKVGGTKSDAAASLDAFIETVEKSLAKGLEVRITGFGTFSVSKRGAREGVNPRTGAKIKIAARKVPKFKSGKALKEAVK